MNISEFCLPNRMAYLKHQAAFFNTFGKPLKEFWDGNLLGFDVVKFDAFINPTESECTYDAVMRQYGQSACDIVRALVVTR